MANLFGTFTLTDRVANGAAFNLASPTDVEITVTRDGEPIVYVPSSGDDSVSGFRIGAVGHHLVPIGPSTPSQGAFDLLAYEEDGQGYLFVSGGSTLDRFEIGPTGAGKPRVSPGCVD